MTLFFGAGPGRRRTPEQMKQDDRLAVLGMRLFVVLSIVCALVLLEDLLSWSTPSQWLFNLGAGLGGLSLVLIVTAPLWSSAIEALVVRVRRRRRERPVSHDSRPTGTSRALN